MYNSHNVGITPYFTVLLGKRGACKLDILGDLNKFIILDTRTVLGYEFSEILFSAHL